MVEEVRSYKRDIHIAGFTDRLAVIQGFEDCEFAGALLDDASDAEEVLRAILAGHLRPGLFVGLASRGDRGVDIGVTGLGNIAEHLLGGGVDRLEEGATLRFDELPTDEQAVTGVDVHHRAGLRCRCVVEGHVFCAFSLVVLVNRS